MLCSDWNPKQGRQLNLTGWAVGKMAWKWWLCRILVQQLSDAHWIFKNKFRLNPFGIAKWTALHKCWHQTSVYQQKSSYQKVLEHYHTQYGEIYLPFLKLHCISMILKMSLLIMKHCSMWPTLLHEIPWYLTHCGLVTPYGDGDLGLHWLR